LRHCKPDAADEGFAGLMDSLPGMNDLHSFFSQSLGTLETQLAKVAFQAQRGA
jgi:hypothetical protein